MVLAIAIKFIPADGKLSSGNSESYFMGQIFNEKWRQDCIGNNKHDSIPSMIPYTLKGWLRSVMCSICICWMSKNQ